MARSVFTKNLADTFTSYTEDDDELSYSLDDEWPFRNEIDNIVKYHVDLFEIKTPKSFKPH